MPAKSVLDKIVEVIKEQNTPGGSSRQALAKGLKSKYGEIQANLVKTAVKKGVDSKVLVQNGQKFWVAGHEPPPPPPEETVDIVDVEVVQPREIFIVLNYLFIICMYENRLSITDVPGSVVTFEIDVILAEIFFRTAP